MLRSSVICADLYARSLEVSPSFVSSSGGEVTPIGRSFANLPEIDFVIGDTMQTKALWISANVVACSIPELKPGNYSLSLSHVAVGTTLSISIVHKPRIARIFPDTIYLVDREKITVSL